MSASGDLPYALQRWLSDMDAETPIARHQADVAETYPPVPDMYRIVAVPRPRHTAHFGESEADNDSVLLTDMEEDDRVTLSETDSEAGGVAILLSSDSEMDEDLSVTSSTDQDSDMGPVDDPEEVDFDLFLFTSRDNPLVALNITFVVESEHSPQGQAFMEALPRAFGEEDVELTHNNDLSMLIQKWLILMFSWMSSGMIEIPELREFGTMMIYRIGVMGDIISVLDWRVLGWDRFVHYRVLRDIASPFLENYGLEIAQCDSARLLPQYSPSPLIGATADFVLYIHPERTPNPEQFQLATEFLQQTLPDFCVNHTDFAPLHNRPLAIGFTTMSSDGNVHNALDRLAIWNSAHWRFLLDKSSLAAVQELSILPGIVLHGSKWYVVLSSFEDQNTWAWTYPPVATTQSLIGVSNIYDTLLQVQEWVRDEYWPWYKKYILYIEE